MTDSADNQLSGKDSNAPDLQPEQDSLTFWQVLSSTLAAAFGVQSSKNRKRDFTKGKPSQFIFMGIGFTAVFVLIMIGIVQLVLP
ncbi:MAG: DUF2970 domain-containing protein [bacterium]